MSLISCATGIDRTIQCEISVNVNYLPVENWFSLSTLDFWLILWQQTESNTIIFQHQPVGALEKSAALLSLPSMCTASPLLILQPCNLKKENKSGKRERGIPAHFEVIYMVTLIDPTKWKQIWKLWNQRRLKTCWHLQLSSTVLLKFIRRIKYKFIKHFINFLRRFAFATFSFLRSQPADSAAVKRKISCACEKSLLSKWTKKIWNK